MAQRFAVHVAVVAEILSLQPGGMTHPITEAAYRAERNCGFWDAMR